MTTYENLLAKKEKLIGFDCYDPNECLKAVKQNGFALKYVS